MKFQIGSRSFTDIQIKSVSGSAGQLPGLTEINISLELDFDDILPRAIKLCCLVASENTGNPVKLFSGFYLGLNGDPINNNTSITYSIKTIGILYPLSKGKPISNYNETKSTLQHAIALITQAGFTCNVPSYRYLEVDDLSGGGDSYNYKVDSAITNLLQCLSDLANKNNPPLELHASDPGWTDIPTLLASNNPIVELNFRSQGSTQNPAPITSLVYDPTDPELCDKFVEPPKWSFDFSGITSIEVDGKFAEFAKEDGETVNTSYSKYLIYPIANGVDDPAITDAEFNQDLPTTVNKLNQVLIGYPHNFVQLTETTPYDPNTPVATGHFYFDKSVPRVILNTEDVNALDPANHNSLVILANFLNLKVRRDNSTAMSALSSATGGAITRLYTNFQDQSIDDFTQAANIGDSILAREVPEKFTVTNIKRETTTEKWQVGQYFNFQVPSQSINYNVVVDNFSFEYLGKIEESGTSRDNLLYNISAKNISKNSLLGIAGGSRNAGGQNAGKNPSLPTYEEIPFNPTPGGSCLLQNWTASGIFSLYTVEETTTGKGFTVDVSSLGVSAVGEFKQTLSIPDNGTYYCLRYLMLNSLSANGNLVTNGGNVFIYVDNVLKTNFQLGSQYPNTLDEGHLFFDPYHAYVDLTSYAGQTVEIKFVYDGTDFSAPAGLSGSFIVAPIRICALPQDQPFIGNTTINTGLPPSPSPGTYTGTYTFDAVNPATNNAEFIAVGLLLGGEGTVAFPYDYSGTLKVNGTTVLTVSPADITPVYFLPATLAGTTVTLEFEFTQGNTLVLSPGLGAYLCYA